MSNILDELKYAESHEWVRIEEDGTATVGITDFAQEQLGDVVFVELPDIDTEFNKEDDAAVVESVKAASDIYAPLSGKVIAVNDDLVDSPEAINQDPYGEAWLFRLELSDPSEVEQLLDAETYAKVAV